MANRPSASFREPALALSWWAIGVLAMVFTMIGYVAHGPNTLGIDPTISERVQALDGPVAAAIAWLGNWLGERSLAIVLLVLAAAVLTLLKNWRDLWFVAIVAIGRVMAMPLKGWYESPRPSAAEVEIARVYDGLGYPSGHAMTAATIAGAAAVIVARRVEGHGKRWFIWGCWCGGVAMTGYARIWYGAHWFTDTLGGAIAGLVIVLVAATLSTIVTTRASSARPERWPRSPAR